MEYKIAIIGSPNSILGFKALGVVPFPVITEDDGRNVLNEIKKGKYAILLITEDWAAKLDTDLEEIKEMTLPAVVLLPSQTGSMGLGEQELRKIVERAVGSDILFKDK